MVRRSRRGVGHNSLPRHRRAPNYFNQKLALPRERVGQCTPHFKEKTMASTATKWWLEADYLQACNCDYGCPCEFEAPPTEGFCEGLGAWRISKGKYGDVSLDGLA